VTCKITAVTARTQFGQIMDRAVEHSTMEEIDAEIATARRQRRERQQQPGQGATGNVKDFPGSTIF